MRLEGKVALISGGARGMGAVEARLFAQEGAKVVIGDVLDAEGKRVEAEINGAGGQARYVHLDVTREEEWQRTVGVAVREFARLDILVNNAGILGGIADTVHLTAEEWDRIMEVNAKGVFLGMKYAIPEMRRRGGGSIVNISSTAALVGSSAVAPAYGASKAAVRIITKNAAIQYASAGIRVNSVHPGPIDIPMSVGLFGSGSAREERLRRIPLGRIGIPEDVAYGVLFLASDESSFVTGSELVIDGGITAQ